MTGLTAELYGGPKDGDEVPLESGVPRELSFPVTASGTTRHAVYAFSRQMGRRTVRYTWQGYA